MNNPIYVPSGRAREYGDLALNIYTGCNHRCSYCYAPNVLHVPREQFHDNIKARPGIVEAVKRQLNRGEIVGKLIHLCFTCDPYPADIDTTPTREIIRAIKESGNNVQILTKGGLRAERDIDLLGRGDWFGVTITGKDEEEPNAAPASERYTTIRMTRAYGVNTWVSFEPALDPLTVYRYIEIGDAIDLFKIGKLNYVTSCIDWAAFGRECERLCILHNRNYYIKDDLRAEMEGRQ